jgi:hypothetical protein
MKNINLEEPRNCKSNLRIKWKSTTNQNNNWYISKFQRAIVLVMGIESAQATKQRQLLAYLLAILLQQLQ